jgi:bifunctional non-homologous end joining protein LigD
LIGYYDGDDLRYAGKVGTGFDDRTLRDLDRVLRRRRSSLVGTGFDDRTLRDLGRRLRRLERPDSPFVDRVPGRNVHWVKPQLVCEAGFAEWTGDGRLRPPRFMGLRRDKRPREVVRERPS